MTIYITINYGYSALSNIGCHALHLIYFYMAVTPSHLAHILRPYSHHTGDAS